MAYGESLTFRVVYVMNLPHAFLLTTHVLVGSYQVFRGATVALAPSFLPFLSVTVHTSWVSQAPRVLSYCADAVVFGP